MKANPAHSTRHDVQSFAGTAVSPAGPEQHRCAVDPDLLLGILLDVELGDHDLNQSNMSSHPKRQIV